MLTLAEIKRMTEAEKAPVISVLPVSYTFDGQVYSDARGYAIGGEKTGFLWEDSDGVRRDIFISRSGACFVLRMTDTGKIYRRYLRKTVSRDICTRLGRNFRNTSITIKITQS